MASNFTLVVNQSSLMPSALLMILILLFKANNQSLKALLDGLSLFMDSTGLQINLLKSSMYVCGVSEETKQNLLLLSGMSEGSFPLSYLGVPLKPTKWNKSDCAKVVDKIRKLISNWGSRHLSYASKSQLISSVIFGIRGFWMSIFCLPSYVTKEIDRLCRDFLWGDNANKRKMHYISWDNVWDKVSLGKFLRAITFKQESLWLKWIHSIYLRNTDLWTVRIKNGDSWYWKKLLRLGALLSLDVLRSATYAGKYSSSKCYNNPSDQSTVFPGYKQVWCRLATPKHRFIFWLAVPTKLLTRDRLVTYMPGIEMLCPVCGIDMENHRHLLFQCPLKATC